MRIVQMILLVLISVLQISCVKAFGQQRNASSGNVLTDPVFGITYNYTKVYYEPIPVSVRRDCKGYNDGSFWTFAHFQSDGKNYYVILGVRPNQDGDSIGSAVEVDGPKCQGEDSTWLLSGFVPASGFSN